MFWKVLAGCICLVWLSACTSAFLQPDKIARVRPDELGIQYQDIWLRAEDGVQVHGWHLKAVGDRHGTVLFFHGNAQNNSAHIASVKWLPDRGFDVFMFDPRGYGDSEGRADIDGVHHDAREALRYVAAQSCGEIVVFGQSLGGAIAIYTVAKSQYAHCVRAVITEGAFSSYRGIAREKLDAFWVTWPFQWPLSFLFSEKYSPDARVANLSPIPLLVMHGEEDIIVPSTHAVRLFTAAKEPRQLWVIPKGGHITTLMSAERRERLVGWMRENLDPVRGDIKTAGLDRSGR